MPIVLCQVFPSSETKKRPADKIKKINRFHVTQFRGFEKFVEGLPVEEVPRVVTRICGV